MTAAIIQTPRSIAEARRTTMVRSLFGDLLSSLLMQEGLTDLVVNDDGKVWATISGQGKRLAGGIDPHEIEKLTYAVANLAGEKIGEDNPSLAAEVPFEGGMIRYQGFLRPVVRTAAAIIRKPPSVVYTIEDYVQDKILTARMADRLLRAVTDHENVLIAGGTGSGKTTLMNALLAAVAEHTPHDRVGIVERTTELQCRVADSITLRVTHTYSAQTALQDLLRAYITRIMVGEVRGAEALEMLMAWNTGHDGGFCTIHSKTSRPSPEPALLRLEQAASLAATTTPMRLQPMIGEAVDLVVCIAHSPASPAGRVVSHIGAVKGWNGSSYAIETENLTHA